MENRTGGYDNVDADRAHQLPDAHNAKRNQDLPRGHGENIQCEAKLLAENQIFAVEIGRQRGNGDDRNQNSFHYVQHRLKRTHVSSAASTM